MGRRAASWWFSPPRSGRQESSCLKREQLTGAAVEADEPGPHRRRRLKVEGQTDTLLIEGSAKMGATCAAGR